MLSRKNDLNSLVIKFVLNKAYSDIRRGECINLAFFHS